jgi:hypothetical protein
MINKKKKSLINSEGRECSACCTYKKWDQFYKKTGCVNNKDYQCMDCRNKSSNKWKNNNKDKLIDYRKKRAENSEAHERDLKRNRENYHKNKEERRKKHSEYSRNKKRWLSEERKEYMRKYHRDRRKIDPKFKLTNTIRGSVRYSLKRRGVIKEWNTFEVYLDFSVEELMESLENKFQEGMSWENYGKWHVDHICPIGNFKYKSYEDIEFKKCWDIENLRPLWAQENWDKKDRMNEAAIAMRKHLDKKYENHNRDNMFDKHLTEQR